MCQTRKGRKGLLDLYNSFDSSPCLFCFSSAKVRHNVVLCRSNYLPSGVVDVSDRYCEYLHYSTGSSLYQGDVSLFKTSYVVFRFDNLYRSKFSLSIVDFFIPFGRKYSFRFPRRLLKNGVALRVMERNTVNI